MNSELKVVSQNYEKVFIEEENFNIEKGLEHHSLQLRGIYEYVQMLKFVNLIYTFFLTPQSIWYWCWNDVHLLK